MSSLKRKLHGRIFLAVIGSTLMSCGGGGDGDGDGDGGGEENPPVTTPSTGHTIGATFVKGLVTGADCELFEIDTAGAKSSSVSVAIGESANGSVDFGSEIEYEGAAIIECEGGSYTDEASGFFLQAPLTRSVVNIEDDASFTVSPLTEIATQLAEADGDLSAALSIYNQQVADSFGLDADITLTVPTDLETTISSDDGAGDYATLLALLSQLDDNSSKSIEELVDQLSDDLSDGDFSDATLNELGFAAQDILDSAVSSNLSSESLAKIVTAVNISESPTRDIDAPAGYSISISNDVVSSANERELEINVFNAEIGVNYFYEITSLEGESSVTSEGIVSRTTFSISDIDISGLADGEITASLYLVDSSENQGPEVTDMVTKDAQAPEGYRILDFTNLIGSDNQTNISFSISGAEIGDTYQYAFYSEGDSTLIVESEGTVEDEEFSISGIDLSSAPDGLIRLEFKILDSLGNTGEIVSSRASKFGDVRIDDLVLLEGTVTFDKVPHDELTGGLDYNSVTQEPARGVTVEAVDSSDALLATTKTDANGEYFFALLENIDVFIRVKAEMVNTGQASWDVQVLDNTSDNALYAFEGSQATTGSTDSLRNFHAASGWLGSEYGDSGSRAAAPFAILDTVYESMQTFVAVDNDIDFPALKIHWSTENNSTNGAWERGEIGTTFFDGYNDTTDKREEEMYLMGDADSDTDEYDSHVIAHEWTHYFVHYFSRTNDLTFVNTDHSLSSRMDFRVAYEEGLANAVSGMILDDSVYRDSLGSGQGLGFSNDVEDNSYAVEGWFSEGSVQSILYDLYDGEDDDSDSIELGLGPIYEVLVDDDYIENTYFASIYLFIDELLEKQPGSATEINALMLAQDINGTGPDGAGETNDGGIAEVLPVYKTLVVDDFEGVEVCSSSEAGIPNQLGIFDYVFLSVSGFTEQEYSIQALVSSGSPDTDDRDPDIRLWRNGINYTNLSSSSDSDAYPGSEVGERDLVGGNYALTIFDWRLTSANEFANSCYQLTVQTLLQ